MAATAPSPPVAAGGTAPARGKTREPCGVRGSATEDIVAYRGARQERGQSLTEPQAVEILGRGVWLRLRGHVRGTGPHRGSPLQRGRRGRTAGRWWVPAGSKRRPETGAAARSARRHSCQARTDPVGAAGAGQPEPCPAYGWLPVVLAPGPGPPTTPGRREAAGSGAPPRGSWWARGSPDRAGPPRGAPPGW